MTPLLRSACALAVPLLALALRASPGRQEAQAATREKAARVQYLEFVTPDVDATCAALATLHGVRFGEPVAVLGQARTAQLAEGGRIGVRAPLREDEAPVVRPYLLVTDIDAAVESAKAAGAEIAVGAMELPGQGKFAIYVLGGIEHGLWQL